jgi:HlyD family secretion protein
VVRKRLILIIFLALLLGVGGLVYWRQLHECTAELYYSGTIEATQADLAFQVNGCVLEVMVDEGQGIKKEQVLARLRQEEFTARKDQARAELRRSLENLKQLEAVLDLERTILPAEVERAEAAAEALQSQLAELQAGYRAHEVERARLAFQEARFCMEDAHKDKVRFDRLYHRQVVAEKDKDAADLKFETTLREYKRAKKAYELMQEGYRKETITKAKARLVEGQAALKESRSNLKKIDATARRVEVSKAQVQAARAAYELAQIRLNHTELKAPFDGILVSRNVEPGEVVAPGREVLSLADLSQVDLKIYVAETESGKVKPGQEVDVKTDTFPQKIYRGYVAFISPEAEFTPKIIQTHKERVKLVYLVKVAIDNPELELKSGMPADAWFR